ncbi:hypothetical protein ROA7450_01460 [Roseovarius albus]|uniref:Uncharacterized protein n=1 Tax=Roseovarius albus TaxID=1247867 RepID=A0A1X6YVZ2_9RHOB|nr:hypothetical protein [Roseovarius albus]SLN32250.1 hypothetical protein ROA7450_01460 [Roseovarius albus]
MSQFIKTVTVFLTFVIGLVATAHARDLWAELCAEKNCDEFPLGYHTFDFPKQRLYFPMRRLSLPNWQERALDGDVPEIVSYQIGNSIDDPRRTYSGAGGGLKRCCDELFDWFGIEREDRKNGHVNSVTVNPYTPRNSQYDARSLYARVHNKLPELGEEIAPTQLPADLKFPISPSFWMLFDRQGALGLVSREPILAGSYVFASCTVVCKVWTLRPRGGAKRPALSVYISSTTYRRKFGSIDDWRAFSEHQFVPEITIQTLEDLATYIRKIDTLLQRASQHPERK